MDYLDYARGNKNAEALVEMNGNRAGAMVGDLINKSLGLIRNSTGCKYSQAVSELKNGIGKILCK